VKKVRGEFRSCEVCGITVDSADVWNEHISGKKHAKRQAKADKKKKKKKKSHAS